MRDLSSQTGTSSLPEAPSYCVGKAVGVTRGGRPLVDFPGSLTGPVEARAVRGSLGELTRETFQDQPVVLAFENGDLSSPVILGVVEDVVLPSEQEPVASGAGKHEVVLDDNRIVLDAKEEILLRCGKGSITLRKDGKILIKGINLTSRATAANRIKGGVVAVN